MDGAVFGEDQSDPVSQPSETHQPAAPGWYPDAYGNQQYWDGASWTPSTAASMAPMQYASQSSSASDDKTMAVLAHAGAILVGFWAPLIVWLMKKDSSPYVRDQAAEALNFNITLTIAMVIAAFSIIVLIGLVLLPLVWLGGVVLQIMAAMAASRGELYRYPVNLRLIS